VCTCLCLGGWNVWVCVNVGGGVGVGVGECLHVRACLLACLIDHLFLQSMQFR